MSSCLTILHLESAAQAREAGYEELVGPSDLYNSTGWLAIEQRLFTPELRFILAADPEHGPLAAVTYQTIERREEAPPIIQLPLHGPEDCYYPSLYCGSRWNAHTTVLERKGVDPSLRAGALRAILASLNDVARDRRCRSISFSYVDGTSDTLLPMLRDAGYFSLSTSRAATLRIPAGGFSAYLRKLKKSHRRQVRRDRNLVREAGLDVEVGVATQADVDELLPLQRALYRRHGIGTFDWDTMRARHMLAIELLGDDAVIVAARCNQGALRGFSLYGRRRESLSPIGDGFDYRWKGKVPLYFEVAFYASVEAAAELGCSTIHFGLVTGPEKRRRGCDESPRICMVRPNVDAVPC